MAGYNITKGQTTRAPRVARQPQKIVSKSFVHLQMLLKTNINISEEKRKDPMPFASSCSS